MRTARDFEVGELVRVKDAESIEENWLGQLCFVISIDHPNLNNVGDSMDLLAVRRIGDGKDGQLFAHRFDKAEEREDDDLRT